MKHLLLGKTFCTPRIQELLLFHCLHLSPPNPNILVFLLSRSRFLVETFIPSDRPIIKSCMMDYHINTISDVASRCSRLLERFFCCLLNGELKRSEGKIPAISHEFMTVMSISEESVMGLVLSRIFSRETLFLVSCLSASELLS